MAEYVVLIKMTPQAATKLQDMPASIEQAHQLVAHLGGTVLGCYLLLGPWDFIGIYDLPDDEAAAAFALGLSSTGMVTTQTMRAFAHTKLGELAGKLPH